MPHARSPSCPNCEAAIRWVRCSLPKKGFVVHSYECPKCTFLYTAVEPDTAIKAEGWLNSELRPPEK